MQPDGNEGTVIQRKRWWLVCWVVLGVGFDWYCAFQWFSGRWPMWSEPVLVRMSLIVVLCAAVSFLVVYVIRTRWRDTAVIFFAISLNLCANLMIWWSGHR